jgi:hypothetical protein
MQRLANGTQVASLPAPIAESGTPGFATAGNPASSPVVLPSIWDADQYNRIQEELIAVILAAGLTLDPNNNSQLLLALIGRVLGKQYVTASNNVTVPQNIYHAFARVWGAGGGGGGSNATGIGGGGGGGGGYSEGLFPVTPGQVIPVTIGAPGSAGAPGGQGGNGGTTSFGSFNSATGGIGGTGAAGGLNGSGGSAGAGTGGDFNLTGTGGGNPIYNTSSFVAGSMGGAAPFSSGITQPSSSGGPTNGIPGSFPGGGAGGGINGNGGGLGAAALVIIEWRS